MRFKKVYGMSKSDKCPFCEKQAVTENSQGVPVCIIHKNEKMPELKCICGEWLDLQKGKFGPYFRCMRCGNISWSKAMSANPNYIAKKEEIKKDAIQKPVQKKAKKTYNAISQTKKEIVITSDELDFYF